MYLSSGSRCQKSRWATGHSKFQISKHPNIQKISVSKYQNMMTNAEEMLVFVSIFYQESSIIFNWFCIRFYHTVLHFHSDIFITVDKLFKNYLLTVSKNDHPGSLYRTCIVRFFPKEKMNWLSITEDQTMKTPLIRSDYVGSLKPCNHVFGPQNKKIIFVFFVCLGSNKLSIFCITNN